MVGDFIFLGVCLCVCLPQEKPGSSVWTAATSSGSPEDAKSWVPITALPSSNVTVAAISSSSVLETWQLAGGGHLQALDDGLAMAGRGIRGGEERQGEERGEDGGVAGRTGHPSARSGVSGSASIDVPSFPRRCARR